MLYISFFLAVLYSCVHQIEAGCGCASPCAATACAPMPPPCPPPVICPPAICPPPPPCPPPLPPPPPPPPPPCPIHPPPICMPRPFPFANECCNRCARPCAFRSRRRRSVSEIFSIPDKGTFDDPECNNQKLKEIMLESITNDITESRRRIQKVAEEKLNEQLNVICVKGDLSYYAYTELFCQTTKQDITCYAFKPT